jgi:hypothetical protein
MTLLGPLVGELAAVVGFLAGAIAVGGFLAHAGPVLAGDPEDEIRQTTVFGGMAGLSLGLLVMLLSAIFSRVTA